MTEEAEKPTAPLLDAEFVALLRCPASGEPLVLEGDRLVCKASGKAYRIEDGIPILLVEEAESIT